MDCIKYTVFHCNIEQQSYKIEGSALHFNNYSIFSPFSSQNKINELF